MSYQALCTYVHARRAACTNCVNGCFSFVYNLRVHACVHKGCMPCNAIHLRPPHISKAQIVVQSPLLPLKHVILVDQVPGGSLPRMYADRCTADRRPIDTSPLPRHACHKCIAHHPCINSGYVRTMNDVLLNVLLTQSIMVEEA